MPKVQGCAVTVLDLRSTHEPRYDGCLDEFLEDDKAQGIGSRALG